MIKILEINEAAAQAGALGQISIVGTSALLPGNSAWRTLESDYPLVFGELCQEKLLEQVE
jgi:hypothetical protein